MIQYLPGTYPLGRREAGGICGHLQSEEGQDVLKRFAEAESSGQLMTCWRDAEDVKKISKDNPSNHQDDYIFTRGIPIKLQFKPLIPVFFGQKQSYGELDLMICSRLRGDKAVLHMQLPNLRMQLAAAGQRHSMKAKTKWTKMSHSIRWHIEKTCRNTWTKLLGPRCNLIKTILLDFLFDRWFFSDDFVTFSRGEKTPCRRWQSNFYETEWQRWSISYQEDKRRSTCFAHTKLQIRWDLRHGVEFHTEKSPDGFLDSFLKIQVWWEKNKNLYIVVMYKIL